MDAEKLTFDCNGNARATFGGPELFVDSGGDDGIIII